MAEEKKKKITYQSKLLWLQKNHIVKKEKPSIATVNRLYSFYHRNPLDTPQYIAYGIQKHVNQNIEQKGGDYKIQTPQGDITVKNYMKKTVKTRVSTVKKKLSYQASFSHSKYKKYMHRVQDYLVYRPNLSANEENYAQILKKVQKQLLPMIRKDVDLVARNFDIFYKTTLIGAVTSFKSLDFPQGEGFNYQRVGFIRLYKNRYQEYLDFFIDELFKSIKNGFRLVYEYDKMNVTMFKIELIFTSDERASIYEKLRVD